MIKAKKVAFIAVSVVIALLLAVGSLLCVPGVSSFVASGLGFKQPVYNGGATATLTVGDSYTVPAHQFEVGGTSYVADAIVISPSGKVTEKETFTLDEAGKYTINYTLTQGGQLYTETKDFIVNYPVATVGEGSTLSYGAPELATTDPGLMVSLKEGDVLEFSQTIDLTNAKKGDYFAEFYPVPSTKGSADAEQFWLMLTDVEDPESFIVMRANNVTAGTMDTTYFLIKGDGQNAMVGYESSWDRLHKDNQYGAWHALSLSGKRGGYYDRNGALNTLRISYDAVDKIFWLTTSWGANTPIADLDNEKQLGDSLWKGFTSGKVKLSFYCKSYLAERANYVFKQVKGTNLQADSIRDITAPTVSVNEPKYDAVVGSAYPIPEYTVSDDLSGVAKVNVTVMKDGNAVEIVNGRFTPATVGEYSVTYTVKDYFGNEANETIAINCSATATALSVTAPTNMISTANRGEKIILPSVTVTGGVGENSTYVSADGQILEGGEFTPMETGEYAISYVVEDEIGQKEVLSYNVNVVNGAQPVFRDEPVLPIQFLCGFSYRDPKLYAYDYSSGAEVKVPATLSVTDAAGTRAVDFGGGFMPMLFEDNQDIALTWTAGGSTLTRKVKGVFPLSNEGVIIDNYFVKEGVTLTPQSGYIEVKANKPDGSWTYAIDLIGEGFTLGYTAIPKQTNFEKLSITLTDSVDANVSVTLEVAPDEYSRSTVRVGKRYGIVSSGYGVSSASNNFAVAFKNNEFGVGSAMIKVDKTDNGDAFDGFPSGTVYATVKFHGATVGDTYRISELCGQTMGVLASDRIRAQIYVNGKYGGSAMLGEKATVPVMVARDVLNPSVVTYVSVKDPNGNYVKTDDGVLLQKAKCDKEYEFTLASYGQYQFEYVAEDSLSGRVSKLPFVLSVPDAEKPVVTPDTPFPTSVKVGELIVIPNLTVNDNITDAENATLVYCVITPNGKIMYLPEGSNSFKPSYTGVYEVRVLVYDEAGNIAMISHDVNVVA